MTSDDLITPKLLLAATRKAPLITVDCPPIIRFILAATSAGQLVQLDKRFLDPRRPIVPGGPQKMSAEDREEVREL